MKYPIGIQSVEKIRLGEYDKPMLQAISNEELQNEYRNTLKALYSVMKTQDRYICFGFLTGVTKFGKVNVFSDLNKVGRPTSESRMDMVIETKDYVCIVEFKLDGTP